MKKVLLLLAAALFIMAGCSQGVRYSPGELSAFTPEVREYIKDKKVSIGMSMSAVRYAWGAPKKVRTFPEEDKEIWVYSSFRVYLTELTFVGGKVVVSSSGLSINNPISLPEKDKEPPAAENKAGQ